jgi:Holliday junction resolvasome RuvABC endonuclease subunit
LRSFDVQWDVSKFAGDVIAATQQFTVDDHADAHAVSYTHVNEILRAHRFAAFEPQQRQGASAA